MPEIDEETLTTWRAFLNAHARVTRAIGRDLAAAGLPDLSWYDLLWALYRQPSRSLRVNELADAVVLSPTAMSRFVDRVEAAGYVRREPDPARPPRAPGHAHRRGRRAAAADVADLRARDRGALRRAPREPRVPAMPDLIRIRRLGFVNAYLVTEDDGLTLVDTARPAQRQGDPRGRRAGGRADRADRAHARARRSHRIARRARGRAPGRRGDHLGARGAAAQRRTSRSSRTSREAKLRGSWPGARTRPTRTVQAGDRVGSLEVIAAPGHTPGQVAFLDTRDQTLLCGDAFTTLGGVETTARLSWPFPLAAHGDVAPPDGGRDRAAAARAAAGPPRSRPRTRSWSRRPPR